MIEDAQYPRTDQNDPDDGVWRESRRLLQLLHCAKIEDDYKYNFALHE